MSVNIPHLYDFPCFCTEFHLHIQEDGYLCGANQNLFTFMRIPIIAFAAMTAATMAAQTVTERTMNYRPDGRGFACVNGKNRFTRALYGGHALSRMETSDVPVFAAFDNEDNRFVRFRLSTGGKSQALDSAATCEARYEAGRRDYRLTDPGWKGGTVSISVLALPDSDGGVFRITTSGFTGSVTLEALCCETRRNKFDKLADICRSESLSGLEPADNPVKAVTVSREATNTTVYAAIKDRTMTMDSQQELSRMYDKSEKARVALAGMVTFTTPDPYINPLGGTLVMAADGAWDGETWLHGAVAWRMPLPGWRGAYAGDFLGMPDRQRSHFDAYARSQVTNVPQTIPHPAQDPKHNMARELRKWGTPMYSNGYICRTPGRNDRMHHYDMNLVYIDELLWHLSFDADTAYMRKMWPVLKLHLDWEKRNWDPDGDGLYDAFCCIWASDALQYNSGAVTHSSAYNYRGNLLAARIAGIIGEDPEPYRAEAARILDAMDTRLWLRDGDHWAEYQDFMGLKRLHRSAALWSVYTPIDCGACSPEQAYKATQYVDREIPRIPFRADGTLYETVSTTNWMPYEWSLNNVAFEEVMHTALAYWQAGRPEAAYRLMKGTVIDFMYAGKSPGNAGQESQLDKAMGECYRDFTDATGIASRALVQGLYGITPDALNGRCIIRPGFPLSWDSASVHTPYLDYSFRRVGGKEVYTVRQNFRRPLKIVIRRNTGRGRYADTEGSSDSVQTLTLQAVSRAPEEMLAPAPETAAAGTAFDDVRPAECRPVDMSELFNSGVSDIFRNKYISPRSPYTTLQIPVQGIGDWCSTKRTARIDDSKFRSRVKDGTYTALGIPFSSPAEGHNIVYTSLWDNYPDSVTVPLRGRGTHAYLLMAGSTNPMQSRIANGMVRVEYADGSADTLELTNPDNWCPIEQDYVVDGKAFRTPEPRPYRIGFESGTVSRTLAVDMGLEVNDRLSDIPMHKAAMLHIPGGAAQMLDMPLNPKKKLRSITVRTLSNDVVIGLMGVTIQGK